MLTRTELAQLLHFAADLLKGAAAESPETASDPNGGGPAPVKRRGRPAKTEETPATEVASAPQEHTAEARPAAPTVKGKTMAELQAAIQPLVKAVRGSEVQQVINKYAPADFGVSKDNNYRLSLLAEHPEHHDSFIADIQTLLM